MLFVGHVTAGCRAPTHARKRTYVYYVHTSYVHEYLNTQQERPMAIVRGRTPRDTCDPEDYASPSAMSGSRQAGTQRSLSLLAARVGPGHEEMEDKYYLHSTTRWVATDVNR